MYKCVVRLLGNPKWWRGALRLVKGATINISNREEVGGTGRQKLGGSEGWVERVSRQELWTSVAKSIQLVWAKSKSQKSTEVGHRGQPPERKEGWKKRWTVDLDGQMKVFSSRLFSVVGIYENRIPKLIYSHISPILHDKIVFMNDLILSHY